MTSQINGGAVNSFSYDNAGRMTSDGVNSYGWDRANRLLSMGGSSYLYDGMGRRVQQTVSAQVTQYLLDTQPDLWQVLAATQGIDTTRYVHGPMGIQEQQNPDTAWLWMVTDGLGNIRGVVDSNVLQQESRLYSPYGEYDPNDAAYQTSGSQQTIFGFTGEPTDGNGLVQLRARYYNPASGIFPSLDPLEGDISVPMSLNRYSYIQGNVTNAIDPSGMLRSPLPTDFGSCALNQQLDLGRPCAKMPRKVVYNWEEDLLTITAMSEIKGSEEKWTALQFRTVGYAIAWVILNRISSPCRRGTSFERITSIAAAGFSGSAIRNLGVYGDALRQIGNPETDKRFSSQTGGYYLSDYNHITDKEAKAYTEYVMNTRIPSTDKPGVYPNELSALQKVRPGPSDALEMWCAGVDGPPNAENVMFYWAEGVSEKNMQAILGYQDLAGEGKGCSCKPGWVGGLNNLKFPLGCTHVPRPYADPNQVAQNIIERGKGLMPSREVKYQVLI